MPVNGTLSPAARAAQIMFVRFRALQKKYSLDTLKPNAKGQVVLHSTRELTGFEADEILDDFVRTCSDAFNQRVRWKILNTHNENICGYKIIPEKGNLFDVLVLPIKIV